MKLPEEPNFPEKSFEDSLTRIARVPMGDTEEEPEFQDVPTSLVPIRSQAGDLLINSRRVVAVCGTTQRAVFRIMTENKESMETLGQLRFHRAVVKGYQGGGNPLKYAFLNFDQVAFLLTLTKTTEHTKDLRLKLILALKEARENFGRLTRSFSRSLMPGRRRLLTAYTSPCFVFTGRNSTKKITTRAGLAHGQTGLFMTRVTMGFRTS